MVVVVVVKKVDQKIAVAISDSFCVVFGPILALIRNSLFTKIVEVDFIEGVAGASSTFGEKEIAAAAAAGFMINGTTKLWHSGPKSNPEPLPHFIWYDFRVRQLSPDRISFRPRRGTFYAAKNQTPTKFQFIGSNDAVCSTKSNWIVLCENLSGKPVESQEETRGCRVNKRHAKFRCLGIKILDNLVQGVSSLRGIRMWA